MDYQAVYDRFIQSRRERENSLSEFDRHHVVPRCLGGEDDPENLIRLSYGDHLFAHVLLAKIHSGLLAGSAVRMAGMRKYNGGRNLRNRYQEARCAHRAKVSVPCPEDRARRVSQSKKGWEPSSETRRRMSVSAKERAGREDWRAAHSAVMQGNKHFEGRSHGSETKEKISRSLSGRPGKPWTPEQRAKVKAYWDKRAGEN